MGVQASSGIRAMLALTCLSSLTVTEMSAPPRIAALIVGCPKNAESARIKGLSEASRIGPGRSARVVLNASATSRFARAVSHAIPSAAAGR